MSKTSKNLFVFIISLIVIVLLVPIGLPFVMHDKIEKAAKDQINQKLTAKVDFVDVSLSFFNHFQNATLRCEGFRIVKSHLGNG